MFPSSFKELAEGDFLKSFNEFGNLYIKKLANQLFAAFKFCKTKRKQQRFIETTNYFQFCAYKSFAISKRRKQIELNRFYEK